VTIPHEAVEQRPETRAATTSGPGVDGASGLGLREYVTSCRTAIVAIPLAVFGVFLPVLIIPYAFADDYSGLWMAVSGQPNPQFGKTIFDSAAGGGRPLSGIAGQLIIPLAGGIDGLRYLRLLSVVGIVLLALLIHWALVRARISSWAAAVAAILICTLPSFQVYAAWAGLFVAPYAALLASGASLFAVWSLDGPDDLRVDRWIGGTALLLAALMIYQPPAMFFWVFLAVALVGARDDARRAVRLLAAHAVVAAAAFSIGYVATKLMAHFLASTSPAGSRTTLTHHPLDKLRIFIEQPLWRALNMFDLTPSWVVAAPVAVVAFGGMALWLFTRGTRPLLYLACAVAILPLSYLPNLVISDTWPPFRTQVAVGSSMALFAATGAAGIWVVARDGLRPRLRRTQLRLVGYGAAAGAAAFAAVAAFAAATNVTTLIAEPQMTELRLLREQVSKIPTGTPRIAFVETAWNGGPAKRLVYDEFGLPSSARPWALEPAVDLILREEGRLGPHLTGPAVDVYPPWATGLPTNEPVIDLRSELQNLR
jgi:hypothetical protein